MNAGALELKPHQREHLQICLASTGGLVAMLLEVAVQSRRRRRRQAAEELAVEFAQQGLRAARMLGLY